jgi:hypothetical protein
MSPQGSVFRHGRLSVCVWVALAVAAVAEARQPSAPTPAKWEIVIAGAAVMPSASQGAAALPAPAPTFNTFLLLPTRRVSSWYFGDGAALLGRVNAQQPFATVTVTPLDAMLATGMVAPGSGPRLGVRLGRQLWPRLLLQLGVDVGGRYSVTPEARAQIETTRASFHDMWGQFVDGAETFTVTSIADISNGSLRQFLTSARVQVALVAADRQRVFATFGAGVLSTVGDAPRLDLTGRYAFTASPSLSYDETDRVTVRNEIARHVPTAILGGGWERDLSERWGVRAELHTELSRNPIITRLDATPSRVLGTGPSVVFGFLTSPALLIYNREDPVVRSTLSGPPIDGFAVFDGLGVQARLHAGASLFLRF